jgi:NitT/TauT family transport system substrate-binding protein
VDEVNADPATAQATVNNEIEKYTTKKVGTALLAASWKNLTFTVDPIASSLQKSATDAQALGLLKDPGDLSRLYDLTLLDDVLGALGKPPVNGL